MMVGILLFTALLIWAIYSFLVLIVEVIAEFITDFIEKFLIVKAEGGTQMKREEVLEIAKKTICQDRQDTYGNAENCFSDIAKSWSVYKDIEFSELDVAVMMCYLKLARLKANPSHEDNFVDLIGYTALATEMVHKDLKEV